MSPNHGLISALVYNFGLRSPMYFKVLEVFPKGTRYQDGQVERTIQTLEDMLRACVIDFKGNWDDYMSLVEFDYNKNYHSSIDKYPFEALYGRRCRYPIGWFEVGKVSLLRPGIGIRGH
ncbi:hypothetical protein KY285_020311 [Solanum tuberosum]|nr:hypothetical protein KY285_020311 [Solanum tuberosum]